MRLKNPHKVLIERFTKKEPFSPPPDYGHGFNETKRGELVKRLENGERILILIYDRSIKEYYGQWLNVLESSKHFPSKSREIRIYPITAFTRGIDNIQKMLDDP